MDQEKIDKYSWKIIESYFKQNQVNKLYPTSWIPSTTLFLKR